MARCGSCYSRSAHSKNTSRSPRSAHAQTVLASGTSRLATITTTAGDARVLFALVAPLPRVLILGAGLDAEPLLRFASELGCLCTVVDHRPAYVDNGDFRLAEKVLCCEADALADNVQLDDYAFAVVMSHHLASDRSYLRALAASRVAYVGLLGPAGRRDRLLAELGDVAADLEGRLHGPAGLDRGGRGPAAIALSIVAEMLERM